AQVLQAGAAAGVITSGTMAPYWKTADTCEGVELTDESGVRAVAMGLVDSRVGTGDAVDIDIRGKAVAAKVVQRNLNTGAGTYAIPLVYSD
ncbi:MAG: hypothetical protein IH624_12870, partial [Phycisphaerae bacterium]|nr:hypothetical protein [Phycisphaerae bacterium]